jgi:hypothetical protein
MSSPSSQGFLSVRFLALLFLFSCAGTYQEGLERRNVDEYYSGSGVVRYFLPELPTWANASVAGECKRNTSARYFDLPRLRKSFSLNYEQALQLQYMYNAEVNRIQSETGTDFIPLKNEEEIFLTVSDRIQAGVRSFISPKFNQVSLIWIDRALGSEKNLAALKNLMQGTKVHEGYPVFISLCLSRIELSQFISQHFGNTSAIGLGHEILSPFSNNDQAQPGLEVHVTDLFRQDQNLVFFIPKNINRPLEIKGKFKQVLTY